MQINLTELTGAVGKVSSIASDMKQIPGILMVIRDNDIRVCFYDGKRAVVEDVTAMIGENEMRGSIVLQYNTFVEVINSCQPTGMIKADYIDLEVKENGVATIKVEKKLVMRKNEDDDEEYERIVSKMKQNISWFQPNTDVRHAVLSRLDYDKLFPSNEISPENAITPNVWDEWQKSSLLSVLSRISCDDGKLCYISSKRKGGFVSNLAFLSFIVCEEANNGAIVTTTRMAKQIYDVISKCKSDTLLVGVNDTYCSIVDSEQKMAVWFEMPKGDRSSLDTLGHYLGKSYNDLCAVFYRPAIENVIKCCVSTSKNTDSAKMTFSIGEETTVTFKTNGGNSADDDFSVVSEQLYGNKAEEIAGATGLNVNLGTLASMIKNCNNNYIMLCIEYNETGKFLKVVDVSGKNEDGSIAYTANYFTVLV